ncbi:hypothetical protein ALMP_38210 [Streptomyces sp. A012304]|nr:hypothetical protein ALMP_38210 [Streptomyces sp. A012304]
MHRLLPPSAIAGVSVVCALGPWVFTEQLVLRVLAGAAAVTAVLGAVVMRRWDIQAGKQVADLTRARAGDEWRFEERVAELESDLEESRELRVKLEQRLRAKRAELAGLRNEHAALLRRYATAETERATALEGRRLLEIENTGPSSSAPSSSARELMPARSTQKLADTAEATAETGEAAGAAEAEGENQPKIPSVFSPEGSQLFLRAQAALARFGTDVAEPARGDEPPAGTEPARADSADADGEAEAVQEDEAKGKPEAVDEHTRAAAPHPAAEENETPAEDTASQEPTADTGRTDDAEAEDAEAADALAAADADTDAEHEDAGDAGDSGAADAADAETAADTAKGPEAQEDQSDGEPPTDPEPTAAATPTEAEPADAQAVGSDAGALVPRSAAPAPVQRPSGHFTVPTAVAVVPAAQPVRPPTARGGFDFFGTQKPSTSDALEAVQNEDLADVVGQEALALHKAEAEAEFKPADEESRGAGQVIDLTAHDETEQIDLQRLRSAVS